MIDSSSHTLVCSVLFVDMPDYSKHSVAEQLLLKRVFNRVLENALKPVSEHDRVLLDTGDGAAITFLGPPEDALFTGLAMRENKDDLPMRMGINLGPVRLMNDLNGQLNIVGDGINVAQRVMNFAQPGQLLVSRPFFEVASRLTKEYAALFKSEGARDDKHHRAHEVYSVISEAHSSLRASETEVLMRTRRDFVARVVREVLPEAEPEVEAIDPELARQEASIFDAGSNMIISGYTEASVNKALADLAAQGALALSPATKVSNKWIATSEHPRVKVAECKVVDLGISRVITGPTRETVAAKVEELASLGYQLVQDIEQAGNMWTAVCESNR